MIQLPVVMTLLIGSRHGGGKVWINKVWRGLVPEWSSIMLINRNWWRMHIPSKWILPDMDDGNGLRFSEKCAPSLYRLASHSQASRANDKCIAVAWHCWNLYVNYLTYVSLLRIVHKALYLFYAIAEIFEGFLADVYQS